MRILFLVVALFFAAPATATDLNDFEQIRIFGNSPAYGWHQLHPEHSQGPTFAEILQHQGYDVINHSRYGRVPLHGYAQPSGVWRNGWIDWRVGALEPVYYFLNNTNMFMPGPADLAILMFGETTIVSPETFQLHLTLIGLRLHWMGAERVVLMTPPPLFQRGKWDRGVAKNAGVIRKLWKLDLFHEGPDIYAAMKSCMVCWTPYQESNDSYGFIDARGHALIADMLLEWR